MSAFSHIYSVSQPTGQVLNLTKHRYYILMSYCGLYGPKGTIFFPFSLTLLLHQNLQKIHFNINCWQNIKDTIHLYQQKFLYRLAVALGGVLRGVGGPSGPPKSPESQVFTNVLLAQSPSEEQSDSECGPVTQQVPPSRTCSTYEGRPTGPMP